MARYAIGTSEGFLGVWHGKTLEQAVDKFLDDRGASKFYYYPKYRSIQRTFIFKSDRIQDMSQEILEEFCKSVTFLKDLFQNSDPIPEGFVVYYKDGDEGPCRILHSKEELDLVAISVSEGFALYSE